MTKASRGRSSPRHQYSRCPWTVPRADGRTAVASAQPIAVPVANPALWCESPCCSRFAGRHRRRVPRNVHSALIAQHRSARIAPARRREALSSRSGAMRRFFFARIEAVPRFLEHVNRTEKSDLLSPRRAAPSVSRFKIHRPAPGYLRFRSLNDLFNLRRGLIRKSAFLRRQTEEIFFGHINLSQLNQ